MSMGNPSNGRNPEQLLNALGSKIRGHQSLIQNNIKNYERKRRNSYGIKIMENVVTNQRHHVRQVFEDLDINGIYIYIILYLYINFYLLIKKYIYIRYWFIKEK